MAVCSFIERVVEEYPLLKVFALVKEDDSEEKAAVERALASRQIIIGKERNTFMLESLGMERGFS